MRGVFFDFEATGIDPLKARPLELAYHIVDLETQEGILFKTKYVFDPHYGEIDPEVLKITGISKNQLEKFSQTPMEAIYDFITDLETNSVDALIAHNLNGYDYPLLIEEAKRLGFRTEYLESRLRIDTRTDVPYPEGTESRKLKYLAADHGILPLKLHAAMYDVATMESIFFKYNLQDILTLARSPTVTIKINTNYDTREEAKKRKYQWNGEKKQWEKSIKEIYLEQERELAKPFQITVVTGLRSPAKPETVTAISP